MAENEIEEFASKLFEKQGFEKSIAPKETLTELRSSLESMALRVVENFDLIRMLDNPCETLLSELMRGEVRVAYEKMEAT